MNFKFIPEVACDLRNRLKVSLCQSDMQGVFYRPASWNLQTGLQNTRRITCLRFYWYQFTSLMVVLYWCKFQVDSPCSYWDISTTHFQLCAPMTSYRHIVISHPYHSNALPLKYMFKMLFRISNFFLYNSFLRSNNYLENNSHNWPKC